jgi:hypothetical protein
VIDTGTGTGTGISQDVLAKVFEPFFTTKQHGKNTGLELSQVYGLPVGIGCRAGGKFPAAGNFSLPAPEFMSILYSGQGLRALCGGFPGRRAGQPAEPNSERTAPSRELMQRIAAPLRVSTSAQHAMRLRQFSRRSSRLRAR